VIVTPERFEPLLAPVEGREAVSFVFRGFEVLVREGDAALPDDTAFAALGLDAANVLPVGLWRERYCRTAWVRKESVAPAGYEFKSLRALWTRMDDAHLAIAGRACQICEWARTHRFCGSCGKPMAFVPGERAMKCACGHSAYPRISPAMMVLVKKGDALLLARNVASPTGRFSALAGFLEAGESVEDAVHRDRALDTYERVLQRNLDELRSAKQTENARIEQELDERIAELRARIEENNQGVSRELENLRAWQARKQDEERRIAEAVSYFVSENPVSTGTTDPSADDQGDTKHVRQN